MKGCSFSGSISLNEMVLRGPEGMLLEVPSRRRGAVVSDEEGLMVEEDKAAGISVSTDSSGRGSPLGASSLPASSGRVLPRRPRTVAMGVLQVGGVSGGYVTASSQSLLR